MVGVEFGGTDSSNRLKAEKGVTSVSCVLVAAAGRDSIVSSWCLVAERKRQLVAGAGDRLCCWGACCRRVCCVRNPDHNLPPAVPLYLCLATRFLPTIPSTPPNNKQKLQQAAFQHKMLLMPSGARESIRFLPALNITEKEIDIALDKFEACCKDVFG